jgi:hypothetical protein
MNGFKMIGERIVDGWRFESLEQARDTFQKHLIAWFPDAVGREPIYVCHGRRRGSGYLEVSGELRVTSVEFADFVAVRRTSIPRAG